MSNRGETCAEGSLVKRDLPKDDRPRERLFALGGEVLSDTELVSILLARGCTEQSAIELARDVLNKFVGLRGLSRLTEQESFPGIGVAQRAVILAACELGVRLARARVARRDLLDRPTVVAAYLEQRYLTPDQIRMGALYLDVRNRLIREHEIFRGRLTRAGVEPRQVVKEGLLCDANGFILFHTHPSGDPSPSTEDLTFTKRVAEAGELLGVQLLDHLIVGAGGRWVSLGRQGAW